GLSTKGVETLAIDMSTTTTNGVSPDGSVLMAGAVGQLITSAGTWTFNTASEGRYVGMLNGQVVASSPPTLELEVSNQGNLFAENSESGAFVWYEWINSGWTQTSAPTSVPISSSGTSSP